MSKKAPAPAAPAKPALDARLGNELTNLQRLATKAIKVAANGADSSLNDLDATINALTLTRALLKDTDAERKDKIDKATPQAVKDALKAIDTEAKKLKTDAEALEKRLAGVLEAEIAAKRLTESVTSKDGCQLILQHRKALLIEDESLLPEEYTQRVPDLAKIEAALLDWGNRCEASKVLKLPPPTCPVPGARIGEKIVLVTKAPELIEE